MSPMTGDKPTKEKRLRLFWDGSGYWGLMAWEAARAQGYELVPINSEQIKAGELAGAHLLVAPGGWPRMKHRALGPEGSRAVKEFVSAGGAYLGFCGGAGLALDVDQGMGLVRLERDTGRGRVPALSGPIRVRPAPGQEAHAMWRGIATPAVFHVWWPGQFARPVDPAIRAVAMYGRPAPGLCSSDVRLDRTDAARLAELEDEYGMPLDPGILAGRPCVLESALGRGRVVLSYLHLDTLGDAAGGRALGNLLEDLSGIPAGDATTADEAEPEWEPARRAMDLWELGRGLGLWQEREFGLPLWRRGARGLEVFSLAQLCAAMGRYGREAGDLLAELEEELAPLWDQGPAVLEAQAERLAGGEPSPAAILMEKAWFPAPRRHGGELASSLVALERALFLILGGNRASLD